MADRVEFAIRKGNLEGQNDAEMGAESVMTAKMV